MVTHSLINYAYTQAIQCCLSFTPVKVHRCTRTRILFFPLVVSQQRISTHNYNGLTLQVFHVNLLFAEALFTSYADNSLRTNVHQPTPSRFHFSTTPPYCTPLFYSYITGLLTTDNFTSHTEAALPSVSPINAGI
jgi:hypothetical protein